MSKIYQSFTSKLGHKVVPKLYSFVDNNYTFLLNIPDDIASRVRKDFYLSDDEEILMFTSKWQVKGFSVEAFVQSFNDLAGLLLTDKRFIYKPDTGTAEEDIEFYTWQLFDHFSYKNRVLYSHYIGGDTDQWNIFSSFFCGAIFTDQEKREFDSKGYGTLLCEALNRVVTIAKNEDPQTMSRQLLDKHKFKEAKSLLLSTIDSARFLSDKFYYQYLYANCFFEESIILYCDEDELDSDQYEEKERLMKQAANICKDILDEFESEVKRDENGLADDLWLRGKVSFLLMQCVYMEPSIIKEFGWTFIDGRQHLFYALESEDEDIIKEAKKMLNDDLSFRQCLKKENAGKVEYKSLAESLEFADRNVMLVVKSEAELAGMVDDEGNVPLVCTVKDCPRSIHLPIGHPKANTLYFAHPVNSDVYLPFETAYDVLFVEMVKEFCYLCQCLGATEIKFVMTKGSSSNSQSAILNKLELEVGRKAIGVRGSSDENIMEQNASETKREHEITYTYEPTSKPYVPNDLVWLKNNEEWNNLVRQLTNGGNLLSYTERISSYDSSNMSSSHNRQLKASFSNLISKVDPSYERNVEQTFSNIEEKEIVISVNFKSVDQLQKVNRDVLEVEAPILEATIVETGEHSDAEKAFIDEIKFAIEGDGVITSLHKVFLEQVRSTLGLSKEVADTLIAEYSDPYTENEKEYMKAVSEYIVDGAIAEGSDRLLARFARLLDINEERALELQSKCLNENKG